MAGGLESLSPLDGVGRTVPLEANERLIEDGPERISWTPGVGYRSIDSVDRTPAKVPPPLDGRPGAEATPVGVWVLRSGPGLVLYVPLRGTVRWSGPAPVMIVDYDRLIYRDGADLVGVGPRDGAVKGP